MNVKDIECPNCGGATPRGISPGEYQCQFCDTLFYNKELMQQQKKADKKAAYQRSQQERYRAQAEQAGATNRMSRRILLFVAVVLIIVFGFAGYMAMKSMEQSNKANEEMIRSLQKQE